VIVYEGTPAVECTATTPKPLIEGMNKFLKMMNITFRRDPQNYRPRINKYGSVKDVEQKEKGLYFYYDHVDA
jgi:ATP-binding cassette subfamily E protein 1